MKRLLLFLCLSSSAWGAYGFSGSLVIDHTKAGGSDYPNYTMVFQGPYSFLASVGNGGHVTSASGFDIVFSTTSNCASLLNWDLKHYDALGGITAWINIGTFSSSVDTTIYFCYGDATVTTFQGGATGSAWAGTYKLGLHLGDGNSLSVSDFTTNANTCANANATATTDQLDGAASFNGTNARITCTGFTMPLTGSITTLHHYVANPITQQSMPFEFYTTSGGLKLFDHFAYMNAGHAYFIGGWYNGTDKRVVIADPAVAAGQTYMWTTTWTNGGTTTVYLNGVSQGTTAGLNTTWNTSGATAFIAYDSGATAYTPQTTSEIIIADTAFTQAQVTAQFNNQMKPDKAIYGAAGFYAIVGSISLSPASVTVKGGQQQQFTPTVTRGGGTVIDNAATWTQLTEILNPVRHQATPFLYPNMAPGVSTAGQLDEPNAQNDVLVPNQGLLYFAAFNTAGNIGAGSEIFRATFPLSKPTALSNITNIIANGTGCSTGAGGYLQMDSIVQSDDGVAGHYNLYSTCNAGAAETNMHNVGMYTTTTNGVAGGWSYFGIVAPNSSNGGCADELSTSNMSVFRIGLHNYVSLRGRQISGGVLTGIRFGTSVDGSTWVLTCADTIAISAGTGCSNLIEGGTLGYVNNTFYYTASCYDGTKWTAQLYTNTHNPPSSGWIGPALLFGPSGVSDAFDRDGIANPFLFNSAGKWLLYFQGGRWTGASYNVAPYPPWALGSADLAAATCTTNAGSVTNRCLFTGGPGGTATVTAAGSSIGGVGGTVSGTATVTQVQATALITGLAIISGQAVIH